DEHVAYARVGIFFEPASPGARHQIAGIEGRLRITLLQVLADDRGVRERHQIIDEHRDAAQRADLRKAVVAHERRDRVDLVGYAFELEADEHLAYVRRNIAADDPCRAIHAADP